MTYFLRLCDGYRRASQLEARTVTAALGLPLLEGERAVLLSRRVGIVITILNGGDSAADAIEMLLYRAAMG